MILREVPRLIPTRTAVFCMTGEALPVRAWERLPARQSTFRQPALHAYNLPAPKTAAAGTLAAPHIVIAVSDIRTKISTDYSDIWYLTVKKLVYQGSEITHLEPGRVYYISHISFSHTNIQPEPEMKAMDVDVEVTLVEWDSLDTDVVFGQD